MRDRRTTFRTKARTASLLRRSLLLLLAGTTALTAAELRVVAPSAPGTGWDQLARAMETVLAEEAGPSGPIIVSNVPGGGGTVGLGQFLSDPSTGDLLVTGLTMVDSGLVKQIASPLGRTTPVARLCAEPFVLAVPASSSWRSVDEFKAAFLNDPRGVTWAGGPTGGIDHVAAVLLAQASDVAVASLNYVAFLSTADAVAAAVEGKVGAAFLPVGELAAAIKAETMRPLAVAAPVRTARVDVPTLREGGLDLDFANWRGLVARPDLVLTEREALAETVRTIVSRKRWRDLVESKGWDLAFLPADEFATFLAAEQARVRDALKAAGVVKSGSD